MCGTGAAAAAVRKMRPRCTLFWGTPMMSMDYQMGVSISMERQYAGGIIIFIVNEKVDWFVVLLYIYYIPTKSQKIKRSK